MTTSKNGAVAPAANGTASTAELPTTGGTLKVLTPLPKKTDGEKLPPLDERLHRLNELFHLQSNYNRLQASLQKLNDFELKKDSENGGIRIYDSNRNEFQTSNPEITRDVVAYLKNRIKEKIKTIEPLLKW